MAKEASTRVAEHLPCLFQPPAVGKLSSLAMRTGGSWLSKFLGMQYEYDLGQYIPTSDFAFACQNDDAQCVLLCSLPSVRVSRMLAPASIACTICRARTLCLP